MLTPNPSAIPADKAIKKSMPKRQPIWEANSLKLLMIILASVSLWEVVDSEGEIYPGLSEFTFVLSFMTGTVAILFSKI